MVLEISCLTEEYLGINLEELVILLYGFSLIFIIRPYATDKIHNISHCDKHAERLPFCFLCCHCSFLQSIYVGHRSCPATIRPLQWPITSPQSYPHTVYLLMLPFSYSLLQFYIERSPLIHRKPSAPLDHVEHILRISTSVAKVCSSCAR